MKPLKRILLVEDSPKDAQLALEALAAYHLANKVLHLQNLISFQIPVASYRERSDDPVDVHA